MPKRKIEEISETNATPLETSDRALRLQRQQLDGHLDQSKMVLFRAHKVSRGFERQKLGRRQKKAKAENNAADTARLGAEVVALKGLELATTAEIHLYKTLLKINTISSAPALPRYVHTCPASTATQSEGPIANVQARLFRSGPVQEAMAKILSGVRAILGVEDVKTVKKKRLRAKDYTEGVSAKGTPAHPLQKVKQTSLRASQSDEEPHGLPSARDIPMDEDPRDSKGSEDEYDKYASRFAASSDGDPESLASESEDSQDATALDPQSITEDETTDEGSGSNTPGPEPRPKKPKNPPSKAPSTTTFLPSLSMGYFSGSESGEDVSDSGPQGRKNRMGQQARRALWEKKFGRNANHVKKAPLNRDEGWDARKGASGADDRGKKGRGRGRHEVRGRDKSFGGSGRGPMSSGANSDSVARKQSKPAKSSGDVPLHPSWEAAKKAKEQKTSVAFQGKKVVFD